MKWENQWGNFPRSSPVSVDVFDVSLLRRKRNIQVRESAYSTRLFPRQQGTADEESVALLGDAHLLN